MPTRKRLFAVIPAAGHSRRMHQPKLLLRLGTKTVIGRLLDALDRDEIADRLVVVRADDEALQSEAERNGARVVVPATDPPDMRASVEGALDVIRREYAPSPDEGWLLLPADHPVLNTKVLDALTARWHREQDRILVPTFGGRRGHPALFRWSIAQAVGTIPSDRGLNWLVGAHRDDVRELEVSDESILLDLDTPADFEKLQRRDSGE